MRLLRHALIAVSLLTLPLTAGCGDKDLVETEVPAGGLTLAYDLAPGATFTGHVSRRETVNAQGMTMNRSIDFDVDMTVTGVDKRGRADVSCVVTNLTLKWALPPSMPMSLNEFVNRAKQRIEGVKIDFKVTPEGKVKNVPAMPSELEAEERLVLQQVLDSLTGAFLVVPERQLDKGASWSDEDETGRKGKLGRYVAIKTQSTFDGMYDLQREAGKATVARLVIEQDRAETITTKDGGHEVNYRSKTEALFATGPGGGYLARLEGTDQKFDTGETTTTKFKAEWVRKSAGGAAAPVPEVQAVDDPCSDEYVGPEDCVPAGAEVQAVDDPCSDEYVGPEDCVPEGEAPAEGEAAAPAEGESAEDEAADG